jgi:hypothetical protein
MENRCCGIESGAWLAILYLPNVVRKGVRVARVEKS